MLGMGLRVVRLTIISSPYIRGGDESSGVLLLCMLKMGLRVVRLTIISSPYIRGGGESSGVNYN